MRRCRELLDTILNEENFTSVMDEIVTAIESEIPRDRDRWNSSVDNWEAAIQRIRNYTKNNARTNRFLEDIQSYFGLSAEKMTEYFGDHYQP